MPVAIYRYNRIIKSVEKTIDVGWNWGFAREEEVIVVTWTVMKHRSRKIKPMMGDPYRVSELVETTEVQRLHFTQQKFDDLVAQIGLPQVSSCEDPLTSSKQSTK